LQLAVPTSEQYHVKQPFILIFNQDGRVPVFRIQHKKGGPSNDAVPFALVDPDELIITENKFIRIQNAFGYLSY
jgi:hypothetical protein